MSARTRSAIKKLVAPLFVCGLLWASPSWGQVSGDVIGFQPGSPIGHTFATPGETVEFTVRLFGKFSVIQNTPLWVPEIRMAVGTDSSPAWATLTGWNDVNHGSPNPSLWRTELTFAYTVRPGDMAVPLLLYADPVLGFNFRNNGWQITSQITSLDPIMRIDQVNFDGGAGGVDYGFAPYRTNIEAMMYNIATLMWDDGFSPTSILATEVKTMRLTVSAAPTVAPITVKVWTPDGTYLQIGNVAGQDYMDVVIPVGQTYVDFHVKGIAQTVTPPEARVYAQRPSDWGQNPTPYTGFGITNAILRTVAVGLAPEPTVRVVFPLASGMDSWVAAETRTLNAGQARVVLTQPFTDETWVRVDAMNIAGENNIAMVTATQEVYIPAGSTESGLIYFNLTDGTLTSAGGVSLVPTVTSAAAAAFYQIMQPGTVFITNAPPAILSIQDVNGASSVAGLPCPYILTVTDVQEDIDAGIEYVWSFGDGSSTNVTSNVSVHQVEHTYLSAGTYNITVTARDKDFGMSAIYTLPVVIASASAKPHVRIVTDAPADTVLEGTNCNVWVELSDAFASGVTVRLDHASTAAFSLSTNIFYIPSGTNVALNPAILRALDGPEAVYLEPVVLGPPGAVTKYEELWPKPVTIQNRAPNVTLPLPGPAVQPAFANIPNTVPFTFQFRIEDVLADVNPAAPDEPVKVYFNFIEDGHLREGTSFLQTAPAGGLATATGTVTHTFSILGTNTVEVYAIDKDGGTSATVTFPVVVVTAPPPPSIRVITQESAYQETETAAPVRVALSQTYPQNVVVHLDVTPPAGPNPGSIYLPVTSVTIYAGTLETTVWATIQDGTPASDAEGFTIAPRLEPGAAGTDVFPSSQWVPGILKIRNVEPVVTMPKPGVTNAAVATVGMPYPLEWSVQDVPLDNITVQWTIGTSQYNETGNAGVIEHIFLTEGQHAVTFRARDKDMAIAGTWVEVVFYVNVSPSKRVIAIPIRPNSADWNGMAGTGYGEVVSPHVTGVGNPSFINYVYTFYFPATRLTAQLESVPYAMNGYESYFFVWDGPQEAFVTETDRTVPLSSGITRGITQITLPNTMGGGPGGGQATDVVQIKAVFSRELIAGDGCGDINLDGIPDWAVARYFVNNPDLPGGGGGGGGNAGGEIDPLWFTDLRAYNDDGDYFPVNSDGAGGVWDFRPIPSPDKEFTARLELRGIDDHFGPFPSIFTDELGNTIWLDDDPHTDPTKWDTDGDGFPDGWEYWFYQKALCEHRIGWRYNPLNPAQGDPIHWSEIVVAFNPAVARDKNQLWANDFDNDGLLDIEELVIGTDPTNWDTDGDGMADGWEVMMGLNPCNPSDGLHPAFNNLDGDYFAIAAVPRVFIELVITNEVAGINPNDNPEAVTETLRFLARDAGGGQPQAGTYTTCYRYGDDNAPWAVGRPIADPDLNNPLIADRTVETINVLILHFQVRDEFGYDPRVAWCRAVPRFGGAYVNGGTDNAPLAALAGQHGIGRWGNFFVNDAPHTRPFTAVDEYLVMKFMSELRLMGATERMASTGSSDWLNYSTHPRTPETAATPARWSGIPDGWKLYIAARPLEAGDNIYAPRAIFYSPWNNEDGVANDDEAPPSAVLTLQEEFWGTDTLPQYANPAQYTATIPYGPGGLQGDAVRQLLVPYRDSSTLTNNISIIGGNYHDMTGVVTIIRPAGHPHETWLNKFWPTDPWNPDTDGDGLGDGAEFSYFRYGNPVDDGSICIPGGGLNPCSVDTDRDGLPDAWEACFAGTPTDNGDGGLWIRNGMDGTVVDDKEDWDQDGLMNFEEYLVQAIRGFRYDIADAGVPADDPVNMMYNGGHPGLPMDMTFEISDLFVEVTNTWDQARVRPPAEGGGTLWFMLPPQYPLLTFPNAPRYASTDPSNPDTDLDGMDDFYELYHGLNPLLGMTDRVALAYPNTPVTYTMNWWTATYGMSYDFVRFPWLNGLPQVDPDADGLLNLEEMLLANSAAPESYNSDPSPLWMTDAGNPDSITARFYRTLGWGGYREMYFWRPLPMFMYRFEMNEGYDTDNDGLSDKDELVGNRNAKSDPRNSEDPYHRQGMWFSGSNSAAATPIPYHDMSSLVGGNFLEMEQAFRSFTVEMWVRPEVNDRDQVLIDRVFNYGVSDAGALPNAGMRRNFLMGIAPDGRVYAGYDNAGSHDEHTDSLRLHGQVIPLNEWTHLAMRMDGRAQRFTLFVNGIPQDTMDTALIPANGVMLIREYPVMPDDIPQGDDDAEPEIDTILTSISSTSGSLTLGAQNDRLSSLSTVQWLGAPELAEIEMAWPARWLDYSKFYQGWMAEVRVWDGARSDVEINRDSVRRLTYDDMMNNRRMVTTQMGAGYSRLANAAQPLAPLLMNYYTFNSLFSALDPRDVAVVPRGFNTPAVAVNRPAGTTVRWWEETLVTSTVYTDKKYIPWIQNVVAHLPLYTIASEGLNNVVADSIYWRTDWAGSVAWENSFPNKNNPYGFTYRSVSNPADMLPLGDAFPKQCMDFWDGQGPTGTWLENAGTTDGGLPQWWIDQQGTTSGWNDLYSGVNQQYIDAGMENGEAYQRDLAKGMQPDGTINPAYVQRADSDGDGLPDWWEKLYGLDPTDPTGDNGAGGDPDMDGLSNYAEFLISEVYGFRISNPKKFKTNPTQLFSDYFMVQGRVPLGFAFSDHDFIEDWWEDMYAPTHANRYVYDPHIDYDGDGWSNWAEARYSLAVRPSRPDMMMSVMPGGTVNFEVPIPIVKTHLRYKGIQNTGNVVIHAYSDSEMVGQPDATWNLVFGGGVTQMEQPLGFFKAEQVSTHLSPGSIVPGTVSVQFTDLWNGIDAQTGFDMDGIIYVMPWAGYSYAVGTVDYITGEITIDMSDYANSVIILDMDGFLNGDEGSFVRIDESYVSILYSVSLQNAWPQTLYLGRADTGYLREGPNYFIAIMDLNGNGTWDPGEPMGVATPFVTDIGWDLNTLNIQLTDYTPNYLRIAIDGTRTEDVLFGTGGGTPGGGGGGQQQQQMARVRVQRIARGGDTNNQATVVDKMLYGRNFLHEGDIFNEANTAGRNDLGLDWGWPDSGGNPSTASTVVYKVWVGEITNQTNNLLVAEFTNRFDSVAAQAVNVYPMDGGYVYSARPTFRWKMPEDYTAFAIELRKGSSGGAVVYSTTVHQAPLRDPITGDCVWEAPFYIGARDKGVVNNGMYFWRIKPLNPKFYAAPGSGWSPGTMFRWDVNQPMQSSGYGQINATVKYLGPAVNLAGRVILEAFDNRGFTGDPAARYVFTTSEPAQLALVTDQNSMATNAFLRGLAPGTYYLRAFIDSNGNGVRDIWESWGYANYYGKQRAMYNVFPVVVANSTQVPAVTIFIEDCDVDQDWFPDAWEYEQSANKSYPAFLSNIGPRDGWTHGDAEVNPDLMIGAGWGGLGNFWMMGAFVTGSYDAMGEYGGLIGIPVPTPAQYELGLTALDEHEFGIKSFKVEAGSANVEWRMSIKRDKSLPMGFQSTATKYAYRLLYSDTLGKPKSEWAVVESWTVTLDDGEVGDTVIADSLAFDPAQGFFMLDVRRAD
ncbi:MAG: PKD domain-containing protein [Kiritimatiellaeota bacterium]|nr:PKD domain-containing protein [Kiritimatiellota bacterium]